MKAVNEDRAFDLTTHLKSIISDEVMQLLREAISDDIFADEFDSPTEEDYEILAKAAVAMLSHEIWASDELVHVCRDCVNIYAEDIFERFKQNYKVNSKADSARIDEILNTAAFFVAISSSQVQFEWAEMIHRKAQETERDGGYAEGVVSLRFDGDRGDEPQYC